MASGIPVYYVARNLWTRRLTTGLTAGGMALVVFVFAVVLMLDEGLRRTLVTTGEYDNVVVTRRASETEIQSLIAREQVPVVETHPAVALDRDGTRLVSRELVVLISLNKRGSEKPSNIAIRGVSSRALTLRPQVKMVEGRARHAARVARAGGADLAQQARLGEAVEHRHPRRVLPGAHAAAAGEDGRRP